MSVAISIVGSAYVNINAITDKVEKQVSRAFEKIKDVQVKVSADISAALKEIEEVIDTIEAVEANIKIDIDTKSVDEAVSHIEATDASIPINVDTAAATDQVDDFVNENREIHIPVNPDTAYASSRLAWLGRARFVEFFAQINKKAFAQTAATLASLSGGTYVLDRLKSMNEYLLDLGMHAPKISLVSTAIAGITGAVSAALSNILVLGGSLAQVAGVGLVLPGIFAGMAIGMATMTIALKDASKYLEDLKGHFTETKQIISDNFWAPATQPIKDFVNGIMPQFKDSIAGVSTALGGFAAATANAFSTFLTAPILKYMMDNLRESIDIASGAMDLVVESLITLGMVGSEYLPRLAEWFVRISASFNDWLSAADADGRLRDWIENGIDAMYDLGKIVVETSRIFYALYQAAETAGGATLETLGGALERIADIVSGPVFQTTLVQVFRGGHAAMEGMLTALVPLGNALSVLGPSIETSLGLAGTAIGILGTNLANLFGQAAVGEGLVNLFTGIKSGAEALAPAMGPLGTAVGALGTVIGALAANLGPVIAAVISGLAPALTTLLEAVTPLIPQLGESLIGAIEAISPVIQELAVILADSLPALVGFITGVIDIASAIIDFLGPALPGIIASFAGLAVAIKGVSAVAGGLSAVRTASDGFKAAGIAASVFGTNLQGTGKIATVAKFAVSGVSLALRGVSAALAVISGPIGIAIAVVALLVAGFVLAYNKIGWFKDFVDGALDGIGQAFQWLGDKASGALSGLGDMFSSIGDALGVAGAFITGVLESVGNGVTAGFEAIGAAVGAVGSFFADAFQTIANAVQVTFDFIGRLLTLFYVIFEAIFTGIVNIGAILFNLWLDSMKIGLEWLSVFWSVTWQAISDYFTNIWNGIVAFFAPIFQAIQDAITVGLTFVQTTWNTVWQAIVDFFVGIWNGIVAFITPIIQAIHDTIYNFTVLIQTVWNTVWQAITDFFITIWNGIVAFLAPIIQSIHDTINLVITNIQTIWTNIWNVVSTTFMTIWNNIVAFITPIVTGIQTTITNTVNTISSTWSAVWGAIQTFLEGVWGIMTALVSIAVSNLQTNISNTINTISGIWSSVWGTISSFFSNIWSGIVSAASGFLSSVQDRFRAVTDFIGGIRDRILGAFAGAAGWLTGIGSDIMAGLGRGFSGAIGAIMAEVHNVGAKIKQGFKDFFGIASPSRVMRDEVGKMLGAGLAIGMERSISEVEKASNRLSKAAMIDEITINDPNANLPIVPKRAPSAGSSSTGTDSAFGASRSFNEAGSVIHVHPSAGLDETQVGKAAAHELFWQSMQSTNRT